MFKKKYGNPEQTQLYEYFSKRSKDHWKKKIPKGKEYFYTVHDPYEVIGENSGYEKFYLVGDNWINAADKPIAIAVGFNDWKFGFIADYLPEFRVAFAPRKLNNHKLIPSLMKLTVQPEVAVIWGYNESKTLRRYLNYKKISIWRAEDGFIRSADLGANGATPYSLVFDKSGLYYNPNQPSDIEDILNNYDFEKNENLKSQAEEILRLIIDLKISKYNPPIIYHDTSLKLKKRVLVVGQVDNDASIRYGNTDGWTMEDMVRLAKYEHPDAEILYRPHPEVYKGFQQSKFKKNNIEHFAKVLSPDEHIIDLIERVDHVYTITSLTGLEALLRGKKVTVLGRPFYAGWGLTDDRSEFKSEYRTRKLKLWELFLASYLIYPRYLSVTKQDSLVSEFETNLLAVIGRINAEKLKITNKIIKNNNIKTNVPVIELAYVLSSHNTSSIKSETLSHIFQGGDAFFQEVISLMLISISKDNKSRDVVLKKVRSTVDLSVFNKLLLFTKSFYSGAYLIDQWRWVLIESSDYEHAKEYVTSEYLDNKTNVNSLINEPDFYNNYFEISMASKNFDSAKKYLASIIMIGNFDLKDILKKCINICSLTFELRSAINFSTLLMNIDVFYANRLGALENFRASIHSELNTELILKSSFDIATYKPDKIFYTDFLLSNLKDRSKEKNIKQALISSLRLDNDISIRRVNGFIAVELFDEAENLALKLLELKKDNASDSELVVYTQALSFNGKVEKAITILERYIKSKGLTKVTATEVMRLYVLNSEYSKSLDVLNKSLSLGIDIGEMHRRKSYFGNKQIGNAFETFKHLNISKLLNIYFKDKYFNDLESFIDKENVFFISIFGPGDEIRFASIYNQIKRKLPNSKVSISCSPRLWKLLSSSFKDIEFISVERPRNDDKILVDNYTDVPGADIAGIIDNRAIEAINTANGVALVTSMLYDVLPNYNSFLGSSYLVCDRSIKYSLKKELHKELLLVGLSWRSSLTTSARNEHYLTIEELECLFKIDNIQFVNLQYDDSSEEVAWVNERYPGKLLDLENIDQYNDFDSVAALMSCMDLVIAPATTVAELAGALGVNTWLFSNSSEIDWRKKDKAGTDVWHNSVTIVDVPQKGDKKALVEEIYKRLVDFVSE